MMVKAGPPLKSARRHGAKNTSFEILQTLSEIRHSEAHHPNSRIGNRHDKVYIFAN
jgi:hypothetical protein